MFDMIKGYSIEWRNGGYYFTVHRNGKKPFTGRNKYPTHYSAEVAAIRYKKAH